MKAKKIFLILTAIILVVSVFSGCGSKKAVSSDKSASSESAVSKNSVENSKKIEQFNKKVSGLVDTSKYDHKDRKSTDGKSYDSCSYSLLYKNQVPYNFDYSINFSNGSSITLPISFSEMKKTDWTTETEDNYQISNKTKSGIRYTNSAGEEITLWAHNPSDSDEEVNVNLSDSSFYEAQLTVYDYSGKKSDTAPEFTVMNGIHQDSTMEDVIKALGAPTYIMYYPESSKVHLYYNEYSEADYSNSISLNFIDDGEHMESLSYKYN